MLGKLTAHWRDMYFSKQQEYFLLSPSEGQAGNRQWRWWHVIAYGASLLALLGTAAFGGYHFGSQRNTGLLAPIGHIDHTFYYNRHFGARPDADSNKWWEKVVPKGRGFIYNPEVSPDPVGLSVFHQLHCLDALRRSYYAVQDGTDHLSNHTMPGHVRHCIDYLRQSIMCHADTTLEPIDPVLGGVTGWGVMRKCRDVQGLLVWADKWRTHNQTSIT